MKFLPSGVFFAQGTQPLSTVVINARLQRSSYYEVSFVAPGVVQCGFGQVPVQFSESDGCGDLPGTYACDPKRMKRWNYNATSYALGRLSNVPGDVLGCAFNADDGTIEFFRNGIPLGIAFTRVSGPLYPMISVQPCAFVFVNMGQHPFRFPVDGYHPVVEPEPRLYQILDTCLPRVMVGDSLDAIHELPLMYQYELAVLSAVVSQSIPLFYMHENAAAVAERLRGGEPPQSCVSLGPHDAETEHRYLQLLASTPYSTWFRRGISPILTPTMTNGPLALLTGHVLAARLLETPDLAEAVVRALSTRALPSSTLDLETQFTELKRSMLPDVANNIVSHQVGLPPRWHGAVADEARSYVLAEERIVYDLAILLTRWYARSPVLARTFFTALSDRALRISRVNNVLALSVRESFALSAACALAILVASVHPIASPDLPWLPILSARFSLPDAVLVGGAQSNCRKFTEDIHATDVQLPALLPTKEVSLKTTHLIGPYVHHLTDLGETEPRDAGFVETMMMLFCASVPSQAQLATRFSNSLQQQGQAFYSLAHGTSSGLLFSHPLFACKLALIDLVSFTVSNIQLATSVFELVAQSIVSELPLSERGRPLDVNGAEWSIARCQTGGVDARPRLALPWQRLLWLPSSYLIAASQHMARFASTTEIEDIPLSLTRLFTLALQLDALPLHFRQSLCLAVLPVERMLRGTDRSITREAIVAVISLLARPVTGELTVNPLVTDTVIAASSLLMSVAPKNPTQDVLSRRLSMLAQVRQLIPADNEVVTVARSLGWFNRVLMTLLQCASSVFDAGFTVDRENWSALQRTGGLAVIFVEAIFTWGMVRLAALGQLGDTPETSARAIELGDISARSPVRMLVTLLAATIRRLPNSSRFLSLRGGGLDTRTMLVYCLAHTLISFAGLREAVRRLTASVSEDDAKNLVYFAQLANPGDTSSTATSPQESRTDRCWLRDQLRPETVSAADEMLRGMPQSMLLQTPLEPLTDDDDEQIADTEPWPLLVRRVFLTVAVKCDHQSAEEIWEGEDVCPICYSNRATMRMEPCGHIICADCLDQLQAQGSFTCCVCQ